MTKCACCGQELPTKPKVAPSPKVNPSLVLGGVTLGTLMSSADKIMNARNLTTLVYIEGRKRFRLVDAITVRSRQAVCISDGRPRIVAQLHYLEYDLNGNAHWGEYRMFKAFANDTLQTGLSFRKIDIAKGYVRGLPSEYYINDK